ncbi:hypothetical protein GE061_008692 [Apolygus lucorum]|uniref:Kelch-like protein diablo n=1 Tax=Apolygus lucorum TaxID=248454 RepID=A0A8S9WPI8_APOLU|nr:hypothetical protein GE061_008692 [Apolygus lucorum]
MSYKLNGIFEKGALEKLVEYAYTARLELRPEEVRSVYTAAVGLSMDRVAKRCASYLVDNLSPDTCVGVRSLPGIAKTKEFVATVDEYIAKNFDEVSQSPSFLSLPCICLEVLTSTKAEMSLVDPRSVCRLAFDWLRKFDSPSIEDFTEKTHMLYLALDNSLQDCSQLPSGDAGDTELVQDYKRLSRSISTGSNNNKQQKKAKGVAKPRVIVYSRNIAEMTEEDPNADDRMIASSVVSETTFLALVSIKSRLASMSVLLRLNPPSTQSATDESDNSVNGDEGPLDTPTYSELSSMSSVKCAAGCAALGNKILVCGGYDRGECLKLVELYDPTTNIWTTLAPMSVPRGRFNIAVVGDQAYAFGGCDGTTELSSTEKYNPEVDKWEKTPPIPLPRSHIGVCTMDNLIYCIGGYDGQAGIRRADLFNPATNEWISIAPLNSGRYQAGACGFAGRIWAVGGCDGWNCLASVEIFDPATGAWTAGPPLITPRRGAGLQEFQGKLYCVGGWDGSHSLSSTEVYDPTTGAWATGPSMAMPRTNLGLVAADNTLYAIGGFSSKTFLNTMEALSSESEDWSTFCLVERSLQPL